jgi:signal transduction histidine kinase/ligand-binding sensor domain-containing protein
LEEPLAFIVKHRHAAPVGVLKVSWTCLSRTGILLGILWLVHSAKGANLPPATDGTPAMLFFNSWPVEGAWEPTTVTTVLQAHDGYLWLGTYHGLVRFDGVRFTVFDANKTRPLRNGLITALYEDPQRVLWIGHETGDLTRLKDGAFEAVNLGQRWPGGAIEGITSDEQGDLWLLNPGGTLFRVRDGHCAEAPGGASPSQKACLVRAHDGKLWVASNGRVARLAGGQVEPFSFDTRNQAGWYEWLTCARDGGLWVFGNERLRKWREGRWVAELTGGPRVPGSVTLLQESRSGALLVGTVKDGLYILSTNAPALHFCRTNGLSHDWVRSLCEDHEGDLWLGTGSGFDGLRPRKVKMLNAPDGWQGCALLSFIVRPDGSAWLGTEGAGLYHYERGQWTRFGETNGLTNTFVWSVLETRQGELLVGTWGSGVLVKNGDRFQTQGELNKITAPVLSLFQGGQGEVWIGTTAGLYRYEAGKLTWAAGKEELALPDVRAITEAPDGTLWFGLSGGGLGALKGGTLKQFRKADGLASDFVLCLYADPDGTLWLGTSDNGLGCWQQGRFSTFSTEQGLPSSTISHIVDDGAGNLWLGTQRGILRVAKVELHHCANGTLKAVHCLSYGKAEGLASLTCSGGFQPGACQAADGQLWFPTTKGLALVNPAQVAANPVPPPVVIEQVSADGEPMPFGPLTPNALGEAEATLRIPPGKQRLQIHYTGLSFAAPEKVRFKYKLDGLEEEWLDAGPKRVAEYSYLRPGSYTFRVTACNNDEVWNAVGATLAFTVLPQVWQTWWFQAGCLAASAGAIGAGVLWETRRRVRRKLELLERQHAIERERARIARDIHDELGASLTRITLLGQMARSDLEGQPQAAASVDQIYTTARELTRAMDEIVWAVNPKHDTLDSLVTYLGRFAQNFLSAANIRCRLDLPLQPPAWALTSEVRHNVFLAFKEALNNVLKHAGASEVQISLELTSGGFTLVVADNGRGFDPASLQSCAAKAADGTRIGSGNGLLNMQKRLEEIGGGCTWDTAPGEGTRAKLRVMLQT